MFSLKVGLKSLLADVVACFVLACVAWSEVKAEIEIEVSLKERYLWLKDSGTVFTRYLIVIGAPDESPAVSGVYSILKKVNDPMYYSKSHHKVFPAGPNDPVGVRFMPYLKSEADGTAWPRGGAPSRSCKFGLYQKAE